MARSSTSASTPITGLVCRSERSARRIWSELRPDAHRGVGVVAAERGLDQRRERLDVRAHHDDVAGLEGGVVLEEVQHGVAEHLDLPAPPVARVDPDAVVVRRPGEGGRRPSRPRARRARGRPGRRPGSGAAGSVDASRRGARGRRGVRDGRAEDELHLAGVASPRRAAAGCVGTSAVGSSARASRARAGLDRRLEALPQGGRGVQQEEVHVALGAPRPRARRGSWPGAGSARTATAGAGGRGGRAPSRRRRQASPRRSAGLGCPMRARRRRHSSTCHPASLPRPAARRPGGPARAASRAGARRSGRRGRPRGGCSRSAWSPPTVSELRMCRASGASHGSSKCSSTTSISGHTARSGSHGSAVGIGAGGERQRAVDQRTREGERHVGAHAVVRVPAWCRGARRGAGSASARCRVSAPRPTSACIGSGSGSATRCASAATRASVLSERWTWSTPAEYVVAVHGASATRRSAQAVPALAPAVGQGQQRRLRRVGPRRVPARPPAGGGARPRPGRAGRSRPAPSRRPGPRSCRAETSTRDSKEPTALLYASTLAVRLRWSVARCVLIDAQAVVELGAEALHLAGVLGQRLLLPAQGHRAQERDQGDRRGQQDAARHGVLLQVRVGLEGGGQELVAGDEGHHHLGRAVELLPVLLLAQLLDVRAQLARVLGLASGPGLVVVGVEQLEEALERHLGVDDHLAPAGHVDHHVGPQPPLVALGGHLLVEVAVGEHAGHLGHPPELHLAPAPARLRRAERGDEVAGLLAQLLVARGAAAPPSRSGPRRRPVRSSSMSWSPRW